MTPHVAAGARRSTRAVLVATAALASPVVAEQQSDPPHQSEQPAAGVASRAAPPIVRQLGGINGESTDRRHQRDIELQSLGTTKSPNRAQVTR